MRGEGRIGLQQLCVAAGDRQRCAQVVRDFEWLVPTAGFLAAFDSAAAYFSKYLIV